MPRKKITNVTKNLILRLARTASGRGVRDISRILGEKYNVKVSKSKIAAVIKEQNLQQIKGRRPVRQNYAAKGCSQSGLILLRGLDCHIGLIDSVMRQLQPYLASITRPTLRKLIYFITFSSLCAKDPYRLEQAKDFMRLSGLNHMPIRALESIEQALLAHKPLVDISGLSQKVQLVSSVKFTFNNGSTGFSDAQLRTFWEGPCYFARFFSPLQSVVNRLSKMLKDKVLAIGYAKGVGSIGQATAVFIEGILSGIKMIEIIDIAGKTALEIPLSGKNITLLLGYNPAILSQGIKFVSGSKRRRKIWVEHGFEFYASIAQARVSSIEKGEFFLSNTLLSSRFKASWDWGVLSTAPKSRKDFTTYIIRYLAFCRYGAQDFFRDMEAIEQSAARPPGQPVEISSILPKKVALKNFKDFAKLGQILSILFKETIGGWEPKDKTGSWNVHGGSLYIHIAGIPLSVKETFNQNCFFIGRKQAFIV